MNEGNKILSCQRTQESTFALICYVTFLLGHIFQNISKYFAPLTCKT